MSHLHHEIIALMGTSGQSPRAPYALPVGDPRRQLIRRAVFGTLLASAAFFILTAPTKQIHVIYNHAPWENDPYDTVYSFAMFLVPLVAATFLVQVSLCLKSESLPVSRVISILRGCRVAAATMTIALLTEWIALLDGANRPQWTVLQTGGLVALLVISTVLTGSAIHAQFRVPKIENPEHTENMQASDWIGDAIIVAERQSRWLGPLRRQAVTVLGWADRIPVRTVRHHPVASAAVASGLFGLAVGVDQGIHEGYVLSATLLTVGLLSCGMYAFLVVAGSYVGVVRSNAALYGVQRRAVDASVVACIAAVAALAFRNSLWWIVGTNGASAGAGQFAALIGLAITSAFVVAFAAESLLHSHGRTIQMGH